MSGVEADAVAHFVAKWHRREPEMAIAEAFCAGPEKQVYRVWGSLLHELREALFELSDPGVSAAKCAWWAEELAGIPQGNTRHPLASAMLGIDAPWLALAHAVAGFHHEQPRAADTGEAVLLLRSTADAVVGVEAAVFAARAGEHASPSLARHWLLQRLPSGLAADDQARIPMNLMARHALTANQLAGSESLPLLRDWGAELRIAVPDTLFGGTFFRRARHGFDLARLARLAAGKPPGEPAPPASLWRAWRVARQA